MPHALDEFVYSKGWFHRKYGDLLQARFFTMGSALNLWLQRQGATIIETGCVRLPDDYGAGMSTLVFSETVSRHGGHLWSVDIDPLHVSFSIQLTEAYGDHRSCVLGDSVDFLLNRLELEPGFDGRIDLLYLDSFDYPLGELLDRYGGQRDVDQAHRQLAALPESEIVRLHADLVLPCQNHCLAELQAAWKFLHQGSVVLIDDNGLAGGGKSRLAKQELRSRGWTCVFDWQQTLWIASS